MAIKVSNKNLEQMLKEAKENTYTAYEIGEYYYMLADYENAVEWYEKAATGSPVVPMALYAMGYACQNGEGTAVDLFRAAQFYEEAAEKDIPQACYNLAYFYQNGIGVCRDIKKANRYCEKASESLKRLVDSAQAAKDDLNRVNLSHTRLINSVLENESKWMNISNESAQKSQKIGELQALVADYSKSVIELKEIIESKEKELSLEAERYEKISSLHTDTLRHIDKLNDDIRSLKRQIDELNVKCAAEVSKNDVLCGENQQLEKENSNFQQFLDKYHKELIASQKQIDILNNKISLLEASSYGLKKDVEAHQENEAKTKKQRNTAWIISAVLAAVAVIFFFL